VGFAVSKGDRRLPLPKRTANASSPAQSRAYPKRFRANAVLVAIEVLPVDVSFLVAEGYLKGSARQDKKAIARAVEQCLANSSIG